MFRNVRNPLRRKLCAPLAAVVGLVLAFPLVAAATPQYEFVSNWPTTATVQSHPGDYGWIDITGVAQGKDGRIYTCHGKPAKKRVLVFSPSGTFLSAFDTGNLVVEPHSVRVDADGNVWVCDVVRHQVYKYTPDGAYLGALGIQNKPSRKPGHLFGPNDLAFAPNGDIYVANGDGDQITRFAKNGTFIQSWGARGKRAGLFHFPHSIAVDAQSRVYVADRQNKRIEVFTADGQFLAQWKNIGWPYGLWITQDQRLFMADGKNGKIRIFNLQGQQLEIFGQSGNRPGTFDEPHMITVTNDGTLYVADASGKRLSKLVPE